MKFHTKGKGMFSLHSFQMFKNRLLNTYCSVYFADGDNDGHFNRIGEAIIDLQLYESVKFTFFSGLRNAPFLFQYRDQFAPFV